MNEHESFGRWLRWRRRSLDLTQDDLADQVGCSVITIRKIEADERRPGKAIVDRLAECLAIPSAERDHFLRFARQQVMIPAPAPVSETVAPPPPSADLPANLAHPITTLVGREQDVAHVTALLQRPDVHLVTLTGPGGTGKTQLSLRVAAALGSSFAGRVAFIALAAITDAELVVPTIAQGVGVRSVPDKLLVDSLAAYLRDKPTLLVLDNFEQVLPAAPILADLLAAVPHLTVLVTSRAVLRVAGEHEYPVPPLPLPQLNDLPPLADLLQYPAVALFVARAQAIDRSFSVTQANAAAVAEICCRLDGLPLAIELAAARIKVLTPAALLSRLRNRLWLLSGGSRDLPVRHQALRTTLEWSYNLLTVAEQQVFAQLGVFAGGCTLDAAEAVCLIDPSDGSDVSNGATLSIMDGVGSLLDKSLLQQTRTSAGELRFTMLETIREYARECVPPDQAGAVRERHARYFLVLAEQVESNSTGSDQAVWLDLLEADLENVRAAQEWCISDGNDAELGLRIVGALGPFWEMRGHHSEGRQWLERALNMPAAATHTRVYAKALNVAGRLAWYQGDLAAARAYYGLNLALQRELDDQRGIAATLNNLGNIAYDLNDYAVSRALHEQSLAIRRSLSDQRGIAASLNNLGNIATDEGNYDLAGSLHAQSLAIRRTLSDKGDVATSLNNLGEVLRWQGAFTQAGLLFEEGLALCRQLGHRWGTAFLLNNLGFVVLYNGAIERARSLFAESLALFRELDVKHGIARCQSGFGRIADAQGDLALARKLYGESLRLFIELEDKRRTANMLERLASLLDREGDPLRAAQVCGAAEAVRETVKVPRAPIDQHAYDALLASIQSALPADGCAAAWAAGRNMSIEEAATLTQIEPLLQHQSRGAAAAW